MSLAGNNVLEIERFVRDEMRGPFKLTGYTVANLPDATKFYRTMVFVDDETGGAVPAFSDGTNWRRVTDRAVAS